MLVVVTLSETAWLSRLRRTWKGRSRSDGSEIVITVVSTVEGCDVSVLSVRSCRGLAGCYATSYVTFHSCDESVRLIERVLLRWHEKVSGEWMYTRHLWSAFWNHEDYQKTVRFGTRRTRTFVCVFAGWSYDKDREGTRRECQSVSQEVKVVWLTEHSSCR